MKIEILKPLIEDGYRNHCKEIKELVLKRVQYSGLVLLEDYIADDRGYVEGYCTRHNIDLVAVLTGSEEYKNEIGLRLIENQIMFLLGSKSKYDTEIKSLGISPVRITNGIENCGWLALFNSPNNLAWFVKRTDKFIESLDVDHKWYDYIVQTISNIKDMWIDPQSVKPNIEDYHALMNLEVDEPVKDLVVKHSGRN